MYLFDSEDIQMMEAFIDIIKRGRYISGGDVTSLHIKIFNRNLRVTNCATCIKGRYNDLKRAYDAFVEEITASKPEVTQEPTQEVKEPQIEDKPVKKTKKK